MGILKKILRKFKPTANLLELYFFSKNYLTKKGWFISRFSYTPMDKDSNPLPWFTYSSIHFIEQKLANTSFDVFEYGSGNSTIWFSSKVNRIVSVEHDKSFYETKKATIESLGNVQYECIDLEAGYAKRIADFDKEFDIIIIDGRDRINCAKNCLKALKDDGIVIWDNSDREEYQEGYNILLENGFKKIDFKGVGPICYWEWQTSIFYKTTNCFTI